MTKTQIKKWLAEQRDTMIRKIEAERQSAVNEYKARLKTETHYEEMLRLLQSQLLTALNTVDAWAAAVEESHPALSFNFAYYGSARRELNDLADYDHLDYGLWGRMSDESDELKNLRRGYGTQITNVRRNYDAVIANVSGMKKTKDILPYLEGLGFNIAPLVVEEACTAIMAPVDVSYLFPLETTNEPAKEKQ